VKPLVVSILLVVSFSLNPCFAAAKRWKPTKSLHQAARNGDIGQVKLLISSGANVNEKVDGLTPLHPAAERGHKDVVELLIDSGAEVNAKGNGNWTPLHLAATWGKRDVVELLIAKGADVNAKDSDGRTPMWWAKVKRQNQIVELLSKHGAKQDTSTGPVNNEKEKQPFEAEKQLPTQIIDLNSIANIDPLADPNAVKARLKKFQGLEEASKNVEKESEKEITEWIRGLTGVTPTIVKAVYGQVGAEFEFVRKQAVEEAAEKTTAAIDGVLLSRQERFDKIVKKMQEDTMRRVERESRRARRPRRDTRGRTGAMDRDYNRRTYPDIREQDYNRRGYQQDISNRQFLPDVSLKLPFNDPNKVKATLKAFEGLEKALKTVARTGVREMRGWTRSQSASSPILAKAVYQQVAAELNFTRKLAIEEAAAKTTVAIDGLLVSRHERFDRLVKILQEEKRKLRRTERRSGRTRTRR